MTYEWNFNPLTVYSSLSGYDNVVYKVYWRIDAQEPANNPVDPSKIYYATKTGLVDLPISNLGTFTPYEELTKDQVLGWITPYIDIPAILSELQNSINAQKAPATQDLPPPWTS